jgi:hypothetical protein
MARNASTSSVFLFSGHLPRCADQELAMRTKNVYWLIAAIAVAAVTIALAALIVVLAPSNSSAAAASVPQVLESRVEAMAEPHRNRPELSPVLALPNPSATDRLREAGTPAKGR